MMDNLPNGVKISTRDGLAFVEPVVLPMERLKGFVERFSCAHCGRDLGDTDGCPNLYCVIARTGGL